MTVIYLLMVLVLLPAEFVTVKLTVYFPALLYACTGFFTVEEVLSPNVHIHLVGIPVLLSLKLTLADTFTDAGDAVKSATGGLRGFVTLM